MHWGKCFIFFDVALIESAVQIVRKILSNQLRAAEWFTKSVACTRIILAK